MGVKSKDFVRIAEDIHGNELSAKKQIEDLKSNLSKLSGRKSSVRRSIIYLEAKIDAAYEDTDEESGEPEYDLIASLKDQRNDSEDELRIIEGELNTAQAELKSKENELEMIEDKKAQTLFEIQERARKTSQNIQLTGGMYGVYSGVGQNLQNSLQTSLASLSQAAAILGSSVGGSAGVISSGLTSGGGHASGGMGNGRDENGPLAAFIGGATSQTVPLTGFQYTTKQEHLATVAETLSLSPAQDSASVKESKGYTSQQQTNKYISTSFGGSYEPKMGAQGDRYTSNQISSHMESSFVLPNLSLEEETSPALGTRQHSFEDWIQLDNYTAAGRYIGEGQFWGYKPNENDAGEYSVTTPEREALMAYMSKHHYTQQDYNIYSKDPEWIKLVHAAFPDEVLRMQHSLTPKEQLENYMNSHHYGKGDEAKYLKDPEWKRLHKLVYPEFHRSAALAKEELKQCMSLHGYTAMDDPVYSIDPYWQQLKRRAYPSKPVQCVKQHQHRDLLPREQQIYGVIDDIKRASGIVKTKQEAQKILDSIRSYSGEDYTVIRWAYQNSNAPTNLVEKLNALDFYLKHAPQWDGKVYRGIHVTKETAEKILRDPAISMLGPSSWSSNELVARKFAQGIEEVWLVFVLPENKSGVSITHLARYDGTEAEVLAPADVMYTKEKVEKRVIEGKTYYYVYVHEQNVYEKEIK